MARVLRGEIYWADLNPVVGREQGGLRPVAVVSHDEFNAKSETVIAMAVTSQEPRTIFPLVLELKSVKLPKRSWVKISQIRNLSIQRLRQKLGRIADEELEQIVEGLNEIVGS